MNWIHIPGNVPSLKNSKDIISLPRKLLPNERKVKHQILWPSRSPIYIDLVIDIHNESAAPEIRKGRPMLVSSKLHQAYEKTRTNLYKLQRWEFAKMVKHLEPPYQVLFYFIRDSRRKFDFLNAVQTCEDIMVKSGWLEDDNADQIKPIPAGYHVDKHNAGVFISVMVRPFDLPIPDYDGQLSIF